MMRFLKLHSSLLTLKKKLQARGVKLLNSKKYVALKVALQRTKPRVVIDDFSYDYEYDYKYEYTYTYSYNSCIPLKFKTESDKTLDGDL
jgi:hypothetical protein